MRRQNHGERGMSLVEVTIILMVLALLTAVIAPSVADYVNDAKQTKAKEDVEAIGTALVRMLRDSGAPFPLIDPGVALADRYEKANRVDVLFGPGTIPSVDTVAHPNFAPGSEGAVAALNWNQAAGTGIEALEDHLIDNDAAYAQPGLPPGAGTGGPRFGVGWRGAYISGLSADPWGNRYAVNSIMFGPASDGTDLGWNYDVAVLSAGANFVVDSSFGQQAFSAGIDDVVFVIQGSTR